MPGGNCITGKLYSEKYISGSPEGICKSHEALHGNSKIDFQRKLYEVEELRECDFGIFENKNYKELSIARNIRHGLTVGGTMTFPGGEDPEEFRKRCVRGFEKVIKECRHDQIKSVAVVAHGGTIMSIMDRYARDENGQPDGSYYDYQVKNGEGYELIIADVSSGDGGICAGSDVWRSGVAVSSGENDRSFDFRGGKNYKKLIP